MTLRIAWLADWQPYLGGAELVSSHLLKTCPEDFNVLQASPGTIPIDADVYVLHNVTQFTANDIPALTNGGTVVKVHHDVWPEGDDTLRFWVFDKADLHIFSSPDHEAQLRKWHPGLPDCVETELIPPAIDLTPFDYRGTSRSGVCWLNRFFWGKGHFRALDWSRQNQTHVDFYGYGPDAGLVHWDKEKYASFKGKVHHSEVPHVLGQYEKYIYLPEHPEPFGLGVVEAWASGLELITNGRIGSLWWIENNPEAIHNAAQLFWDKIRSL